jgi:hypothetical protein
MRLVKTAESWGTTVLDRLAVAGDARGKRIVKERS